MASVVCFATLYDFEMTLKLCSDLEISVAAGVVLLLG
jgi:hypothetical protein